MEKTKESLLRVWSNRSPIKWGEDVVTRLNEEVSILQSLQSLGCTETKDGMSIQMQIEERMRTIREVQFNQ